VADAPGGAARLATIGIVVERSSDPLLIGQGFLLHVEDRNAVDPTGPDRISYAFVERPDTRRCPMRRPVQLAREGVPLIVIQRQLGHTNLGITSVYLQGIDNTEIIDTVHARRAPMVPVDSSLRR
jgi:hypothetical protein